MLTGVHVDGTSDAHKPIAKKKVSEKHVTKYVTMVACNSTARNIFSEADEIRKFNEKIQW